MTSCEKSYFVLQRVVTFLVRENFPAPRPPVIRRAERSPPISKEGIHYPLATAQGNRSTPGWRFCLGMQLRNYMYIHWDREIPSAIPLPSIFSSQLQILGNPSAIPDASRSRNLPNFQPIILQPSHYCLLIPKTTIAPPNHPRPSSRGHRNENKPSLKKPAIASQSRNCVID